ncbi:NS1 [Hirame aquareovirus]|nr:NS1 [Hirame aquareovirus]
MTSRIKLTNLTGGALNAQPSQQTNNTNTMSGSSSSDNSSVSLTHPSTTCNVTWSLEYDGVPFTGVCPVHLQPLRELASTISTLITKTYKPTSKVPSRMTDVNNWASLVLDQAGVTNQTNVSEAERLINGRLLELDAPVPSVVAPVVDSVPCAQPPSVDELLEEAVESVVESPRLWSEMVSRSVSVCSSTQTDELDGLVERAIPPPPLLPRVIPTSPPPIPSSLPCHAVQQRRAQPRKPHHVTDDNSYSESKLAYARGVPQASPLYGSTAENEIELAFKTSFPASHEGVWRPPQRPIPVIMDAEEDPSLLTLHHVREGQRSNRLEVMSANGTLISVLNVLYLTSEVTNNDIHQFMAPHPLVAITPLAAVRMVHARITDGVFSKSIRRIVMGIDPVMIALEPSGVELFNVLTQHRLPHAETHATMSLRSLIPRINSGFYRHLHAWLKASLPTTASASYDSSAIMIQTLTEVLRSDGPVLHSLRGTVTSDVVDSSHLVAEVQSLRHKVYSLEGQLDLAGAADDLRRSNVTCAKMSDLNESMSSYLHDHVCINTHEQTKLTAMVGPAAAISIQSLRESAKQVAKDALITKATSTLATQLTEANSLLLEREAKITDFQNELQQLRLMNTHYASRQIEMEHTQQRLTSEIVRLTTDLAKMDSQFSSELQSRDASLSRLQSAAKQRLNIQPSAYSSGAFMYPSTDFSAAPAPSLNPAQLWD